MKTGLFEENREAVFINEMFLVRSCWIGASWFLSLQLFGLACACFCSLRTFSELAIVVFTISPASFCSQICWAEDVSLTWKSIS